MSVIKLVEENDVNITYFRLSTRDKIAEKLLCRGREEEKNESQNFKLTTSTYQNFHRRFLEVCIYRYSSSRIRDVFAFFQCTPVHSLREDYDETF